MKRIVIENIRNIGRLAFDLPLPGLHIITGENGSGKTTLFTCISRICNSNAYRSGFPTSSANTLDVFSGSITYSVGEESVCYTRRASGEWRPDRRNASVFQSFGYPQVINITTKDERVFSQEAVTPRRRQAPDTWLNEKMNVIFNTTKFNDMVSFTTGDLRHGRGRASTTRRRNIAYAIPLEGRNYYTELNFSFGEVVLVNLLYTVKRASNGALILIDELELALHPAAQIRLIQTLKEIAAEKGLTILISTHSASIIKAQKYVIFLERGSDNCVEVIYSCPPAKAIGAIGMREDTNPDIIVLVEDEMAKGLFFALQQKYFTVQAEANYLDIRILEIGGFSNVIHFYKEANNYIFYDDVYLVAFMDKDVETDIIPYAQFGNVEAIRSYHENMEHMNFLPYTPEVLLVKTLYEKQTELLRKLSADYNNQRLRYEIGEAFDFQTYDSPFPEFENQEEYNAFTNERGSFRSKCKKEAARIVSALADQVNQSANELYRAIFKFAVDQASEEELNIRALLAPTIKRLHRN